MKYMLDTNICIFAIKQKPMEVIEAFRKHKPSDICISSITYAELIHGVEKSTYRDKNRLALSLLLSSIQILDFNGVAAEEYGKIRAELELAGTVIGIMDMLIAGHARANDLILVTNNSREFAKVSQLQIEDWTKG